MDSANDLAKQWLSLKRERDDIDGRMADIASLLADGLEHPAEGSRTHTLGGYKVTVTSRINRTIDERRWGAIRSGIPKNLWPVKEKLSVDSRGCRYLAEAHPDMWAIVAGAITERPGRPGISVEEVTND